MFGTRVVTTGRGEIRAASLGSGPELLLLHTIRGQLEYHQRVAPALAKHYRVHLIDLPGHGRSSKDLATPYDAERIFSGVSAFIEAEGLENLTLVGESIGATTALALAARMPERLRQVFAFNPHDGGSLIGGPIGQAVSFAGHYSTLPFAMEQPWLLRRICAAAFADAKNLPQDFVDVLPRTGKDEARYPRVMKSLMRHQASWELPRRADYPKIPTRLPVRLVYGDKDWGPPAHRAENAALIPPVERAEILPATGHWSFLDNPEGALDIIAPGLR